MPRFIDITGLRFGRLVVLKIEGRNQHNQIEWLCRCDCGQQHATLGTLLRSGQSRSCGCLQPEVMRERRTHGKSHTRLYYVWQQMLKRCRDTHQYAYRWYGGRGLAVCMEWQSYEAFETWAYGNGYLPGLTLDRIDNYGGYEPGNCRWVTWDVQRKNKRASSKIIELKSVPD